MANWISNKLKVAETFLQQIDQQAAESLGKGDKQLRSDEQTPDVVTKIGGSLPLKDQLKKKRQELGNSDYVGKLRNDPNLNKGLNYANGDRDKDSYANQKSIAKPLKSTLTDSDWTELLGTPDKSLTTVNRSYGVSGIRGLRKDDKKKGSARSVHEGKKNQISTNVVIKSASSVDTFLGNRLSKKLSDGEESSRSSARSSSVEIQSDVQNFEGRGLDRKETDENLVVEKIDLDKKEGNGQHFNYKDIPIENILHSTKKTSHMENTFLSSKADDNVVDGLKNSSKAKFGSRSSISSDLIRDSSTSYDGSDGDTDSGSGSSSNSEDERKREQRRERREKIFAEKAAAKSVQAIKEREDMVARLEGEKQSLEKILEERAKQQADEASELQMNMMETMEAFEIEKQKHKNTRMETFALLATLETANADLARSLASTQKNLEVEVNRVAALRQQINLKEAAREDLLRKNLMTGQSGTLINHLAASKGVQFERKILEAEYSVIADKVGQLQDKAKNLEAVIRSTRKEMEEPTEIELELKQRLSQLTDHLIHKQAQVEGLSQESSTILFRIEAVSRMIDENKALPRDMNSDNFEFSESKLRPLLKDKIRSGRKHLGSFIRQLDSIFSAGAVFLRRNSKAKLWACIYIVCLHVWVIYIFMSHSRVTKDEKSGAVLSLENINNILG